MGPHTKHSEKILEVDHLAFLASIVECSEDAIFALDLDGTVLTWNKAAEAMFGYSAEEIIGRSISILYPPDRIELLHENLSKHRRGETIPPFETVRLAKGGQEIDVSVRSSLIRDASGVHIGIAVISRDISEQKRAFEAIESANRVKSQFLENMSHEIRTPMNGILGMTELVLDSELTPEQRESLGLVKLSTESLIAAVDDILDFSLIDSKKMSLESIPFDFRESLAETVKMLGLRAQKKKLELVYEVSPEIPVMLQGDPGRIRRVLYSLIGNAIKFTEQGEIFVTAVEQSRTDGDISLCFTVKDTGIGIPPERQIAIFYPFTQADGSRTRAHGGTGLGLAIAARLAELMGGKVWLEESLLGKGSTFHFTAILKVPEKSSPLPASPSTEELKGLQVLIVDDNSLSRRVLKGMLSRWGMRATDVEDGPLALQALRIAAEIGHPFPLVLLDGQMRGIDGFTVADQIKNEPGIAAATIMMFTSVGHVGDAARCRELGIAAYLVKPIGQGELVNAICMALQRSRAEKQPPLITRHSLREARKTPRG